jgi:hypothetical protein
MYAVRKFCNEPAKKRLIVCSRYGAMRDLKVAPRFPVGLIVRFNHRMGERTFPA